jgi:hypothetical protein
MNNENRVNTCDCCKLAIWGWKLKDSSKKYLKGGIKNE